MGRRLLDAPPPRGACFRFDTVPVISVARLIAQWFEAAEPSLQ